MTIEFSCPTCQSRLLAKSKLAGKSLSCPKCGTVVEVPTSVPDSPCANSARPHSTTPATDKQKSFATTLGIQFPSGIDKGTISELIDAALTAKREESYELLNTLQDRERSDRDKLREEVIAEIDEHDPRISVASTEQILTGLAQRNIGAIMITFEYGVLSGVDDLTGETFQINSTEDLGESDLRTIISSLGFALMRRR